MLHDLPDSDLYLVRHGETDWNRTGRFQGRSDIPLNQTGQLQAHKIGLQLAELVETRSYTERQPRLICSPLLRARQTAEEIGNVLGRKVGDVEISDVLTEISFGEWEGLTTHEVKSSHPDERRARKQDRWNFVPPGGESFASRVPAIGKLLADIDQPTVLVCHAGVIKICLYLLGAIDRQSALINPISQDRIYSWSKRILAAH
jgi:probable phosphoglycerate mutase